MDDGTHYYYVEFKTAYGETGYDNDSESNMVTVADKSTDGQVQLTNIPVGAANKRVIARKIYRTTAGTRYTAKLLTTINDNTTTNYLDNTADSGLDDTDIWYRKENTTAGSIYFDANKAMSIGFFNTSFGRLTFASASFTSSQNTAFGAQAGQYTTTGGSNTFIGYNAGTNNSTGGSLTYVGSQSGRFAYGGSNTFIGASCGYYADDTTGSVGIGVGSLYGETDAAHTPVGDYNTAVGYTAGRWSITGGYNVFIGYTAGYGVDGDSTGQRNTFVGSDAGVTFTTGSYNLLLGYGVDLTNPTDNYVVRIGYAGRYLIEGSTVNTSEWVGSQYEFKIDRLEEYTASNGVRMLNSKMIIGVDTAPTAALDVRGGTGTAIYGTTNSSNYGMWFYNITGPASRLQSHSAAGNEEKDVLQVYASTPSGGAQGLKANIVYLLDNSSDAVKNAGKIGVEWVDPISPTEDAEMVFSIISAGTLTDVMWLDGVGLTVTNALYINDSNTYISEDGSGNMEFHDAVSGTKLLSDLLSTYSFPQNVAESSGVVTLKNDALNIKI